MIKLKSGVKIKSGLKLEGGPAYSPESDFLFLPESNTIKEYKGTDTIVSIPPYIGGLRVTSIGSQAFANKALITTLIVPQGVTTIGDTAFGAMSGLINIVLPSSLTELDTYVFFACTSLRTVVLPIGLTEIPVGTFYQCSGLEYLQFGENIRIVDDSAIFGCTSLLTVKLGTGQTISQYQNYILDKAVGEAPGIFTRANGTSTEWTKLV